MCVGVWDLWVLLGCALTALTGHLAVKPTLRQPALGSLIDADKKGAGCVFTRVHQAANKESEDPVKTPLPPTLL